MMAERTYREDALAGKVALVTGAGGGIGRVTALAFARAGARVVVSDVDRSSGEETARLVQAAGHEARFIHADVTRDEEVAALMAATIDAFGRLDCAHNNAGVLGEVSLLAEHSNQSWDQVMAVNLTGVWLCLKHEIPLMQRQGGGAIVNTSSVAGLRAAPMLPAYAASKHGVIGLTKAAAAGYAQDGIRVNAVCPGFVETDMLDLIPEMDPPRITRVPLGRLGTAEDVAAAVVWLCTDAAAYLTGHSLVVDGGMMG